MYSLCLQREFTARHALVGGDWGAENREHAHAYRVEWEMHGARLDGHDFLVDLIDVERCLDAVIGRYRDSLLNDLPEFADANPSLERFARALWERLFPALPSGVECSVRVWENEKAWAGYGLGRDMSR